MKITASIALATILMGTAVCVPIETLGDISITAEAETTKPAAPVALKATVSSSMVNLTWNEVSGADGYRVYIYDFTAKKYKKYRDVKHTSCEIKSLTGGKNYLFKVAALKGETVGTKSEKVKATVSSSSIKWVNAYRKVLEPYKNGTEKNVINPMCSLYDITGDNVPELIIGKGGYHAAGAEIYSYNNGKVTHYSFISKYTKEDYYDFGSYGVIAFFPKSNTFSNWYIGQGEALNTIYRIDGNRITTVIDCDMRMAWGDEPGKFFIDDKEVNKTTYLNSVKSYRSDDHIFLGRSYIINTSRVDKYYIDNDYECIYDIFDSLEKGEKVEFSTRHDFEGLHFNELFYLDLD